MSDEKEKSGGFVVGGISFGVGVPKPAARSDKSQDAAMAEAEPLMPLRVLAIADLVPDREHNAGINAPDHAVAVEPGGLDQLMQKLSPRLALEVESVLHAASGAAPVKVRVDVPLTSLASFRPDNLCREVALLRSLLDGKKALERLREGTASVEAVASELSRLWQGAPLASQVIGNFSLGGVQVQPASGQARPPAQAGADDAAARILDMIGGSENEPAAGAVIASPSRSGKDGGRFDAFIAAVAHSGKDRRSARPDEAIRLVEKALSMQLGAIVQNPEFRRLEQAWRGVALLASRLPKRGVRLDVASCPRDEAPAMLAKIARAGRGIDPPVSFAVVDGEVGSDAASLAWLRSLGEAAQDSGLVAITNASPGLLGHALDAVEKLDNIAGLFEAPKSAPWRAEAHRPAMLHVSLAINRLLARAPYDDKSSRVREARVTELPGDEGAFVWIQPAWAVASLAVKSFERYEWPCAVAGPRHGTVENLPVRQIAPSGEKIAIPTEAFLSTETQRALGRIGILALAAQPNSDEAYLLAAATAYVPPPKLAHDGTTDEPPIRLPQASLGDQLFATRLLQYADALASRIGADEPPEQVREFMSAAVWELFRNAPPPGPEIEISASAGELYLNVKPRRFLGVGIDEIGLPVRIG